MPPALPPRRPVPGPPRASGPLRCAAVPLAAIGESIGVVVPGASGSVPVTGISLNSRAVQPGDLYVALPGASRHGADFVSQAVEAGAAAVLTDDAGARLLAFSHDIAVPVLLAEEPRSLVGGLSAPDLPEPAGGRAGAGPLRRHGHQRQDHHHLLHQRPAAGPRAEDGTDRHHRDPGRRRTDSEPPHDAGIHRCPRPAGADARTRPRRGLDGGLLARHLLPARGRGRVRRRRLHQPDPGPPRPARQHGRVLPDQGTALHPRTGPHAPS